MAQKQATTQPTNSIYLTKKLTAATKRNINKFCGGIFNAILVY